MIKTREELIQQCSYPRLPCQSMSIQFWFHASDIPSDFFLGGKLNEPPLTESFILASGVNQVQCHVHSDCQLFFSFQEKKSVAWSDVCSLLRTGDCLLIPVNKTLIQNPRKEERQIINIKKIFLTSVCKTVPLSSSTPPVHYKQWLCFLSYVHESLAAIGLDQVETPSLVESPGTEPDLDMFETIQYEETGARSVFLPTSPELNLKKLLCRGWTDFYEIKKCFRNKEIGELNVCEFYMLEWYRAHSHLDQLIEDLNSILQYISKKLNNLSIPPLRKVSVKELFKQYLQMDISPDSSREDFVHQAHKMSLPFSHQASIDDLFHLLFLNGIEPNLNQETPLIVYNYPPFQRAYARIGSEGWACRFEVFWKGMELANAFDEVVNSEEQAHCFRKDIQKRKKWGKKAVPADKTLLKEMDYGMPPSVGIALGLERLFLAIHKLQSIKQTRLFP